jgi:hypothetical protein
LSGLPAEISECLAPFFSDNVRNTPEFQAACQAYRQKNRCKDDRIAFLQDQYDLVREAQIQYMMRRTGMSRADTEMVIKPPSRATKRAAEPETQQDQAKTQRAEESQQHYEEEGESCKVEEVEELQPLTAEERAKILARDPWLAKEWDERWRVGQWRPVSNFGIDDCQSYELHRREHRIEEAKEGRPWRVRSMELHKFDTRFPCDLDYYDRLPEREAAAKGKQLRSWLCSLFRGRGRRRRGLQHPNFCSLYKLSVTVEISYMILIIHDLSSTSEHIPTFPLAKS